MNATPYRANAPGASFGNRLRHGLLHALTALLVIGCAVGTPAARSSDADPGVVPPPGRVGKIGLLSGQVTLTDMQTGEQQPASLNWPLTSGYRMTSGPLARAEVRIGSLAVRLDGDSDVDFNRIDDELIQIVVQRGTVALRVRSRDVLPEIDLVTPRERIVLDDVGRYRIDVDRAAGITSLTTFVGAARIATGRMTFSVRSGQRGELGTSPGTGFTIVQPAPDTFDDWVASRDRRDDVIASGQYVSRETTGVEALDEYGTWRTVPEYGPVWYPRSVPVGWAPYRYGRWAYIAPWGWTWIDDAPWGFAPFHYGRWAVVGGIWCWVPGAYVARPIYAPALVAWYGAPGVSVSIGIGSVGWFPLGPREVYIPPYRYNRRYITRVNVGHVGNIGNVTVINPPRRYVHQTPRTSTWVPNDAILRHEPIRKVVLPPPSNANQFVGRPTPPSALIDGDKRRGARDDGMRNGLRPGAVDSPIVRPQPAPAAAPPGSKFDVRDRATAPAEPRETARDDDRRNGPRQGVVDSPGVRPQPAPAAAPPGSKFDARDRATAPSVPPVSPTPEVTSPPSPRQPAPSVRARPMPVEPGDADATPVRRPKMTPPTAPRPDIVRPAPVPYRAEPSPGIERAAPPVRVAPPREGPPPMRGPQVDAPGRVAPPKPPGQPEAPRAEPPRGSKFDRDR